MKRASNHGSKGVALLAVLWALGILALAVSQLGVLLESTMSQQTSLLSTSRALLAAESGLEMVKNPAVNPFNCGEASRQLNAYLYGPEEKRSVSFSVQLSREGGLLNLNLLATNPVVCQEILGRLFKAQWKVNPQVADRAIACLIDWVDPDDNTQLSGAERRQYEKARRPGPRNGPMRGREEFMGIYGWRELQEAVRSKPGIELAKKFTVEGPEKLDLIVADQDLIEAVLGLGKDGAQNWLQVRNGKDGDAMTSDDIRIPEEAARLLNVNVDLLKDRATLEKGRFRVLSKGQVGQTTRTIEAVISDGSPRKVEARWLQ